jgi:hypothetical protein
MVVAESYGSSMLLNTFPPPDRQTSDNLESRPEIQITISLPNYKQGSLRFRAVFSKDGTRRVEFAVA